MQNKAKVSPENEPVFYKPQTLSLVATSAAWVSWIALVGFLADISLKFFSIKGQLEANGMGFSTEIFSNMDLLSYLMTNLLTPLFTAIALFVILQGVAVGLNALLEIDFNAREGFEEATEEPVEA